MLGRSTLLAAAVAAALAVFAAPAGAINYGTVDSANRYSYVGLLLALDDEGTPLWRCSGALISPTLFLTAAHCVEAPAASARIWFDVDVQDPASGYPTSGYEAEGTPVPHPGWTDLSVLPKSSNTYDMGLVVLDEPLDPAVTEGRYGEIAPLGFLSDTDTARGTQDTWFTTVGYGLQERKPNLVNLRIRMYAASDLINLRNALVDDYGLMTTNNPGDGRGGNCSGDSGGPILWQDTDIIVAVNSFALNNVCHGTDQAYRVDTEVAQEFLSDYGW